MRPLASALAALLVVGPTAAAAQGVSVAPKFGSTGIGGDLVLSLAPKLALKGGIGFLPFEYDVDLGGQSYTVEPPPMLVTGAVDIRVAGPLRIMAGLLYRSDDIRFAGDLDGEPVEIGDGTYEQTGRLEGALVAAETAPFVGMGLGSLGSTGFHMYVDLGLAFAGDPDVELEGSGAITQEPDFEQNLDMERRSILADTEDYTRYWPILNVGFRIGF